MQDAGGFEAEPREGKPAALRSSENFRMVFWLVVLGILAGVALLFILL